MNQERAPKPQPSGEMGGKPPRKKVGTAMMGGEPPIRNIIVGKEEVPDDRLHRALNIIASMNPDELRDLRSRVISELLPQG